MNNYTRSIPFLIAFSVCLILNSFGQGNSEETNAQFRMLVFSKTPDFRHDSIPAGNRALKELSRRLKKETKVKSVHVDIIDNKGKYADTKPVDFPSTSSELATYDLVVFNNSNDSNPPDSEEIMILTTEQQAALKEYVTSGGGFMAIHSAVDNMTEGSFFSRALGAYYKQHAKFQPGTLKVPDRVHPSTKSLPLEWNISSEWYTFQANPRGNAHVLMVADESTYKGEGMQGEGHLHPVSWCQRVSRGRSWYTALGHAAEHYQNKHFRNHLLGGMKWAAGIVEGNASGTDWEAYTKRPLKTDTLSPTVLDIAPDGRVFYVDRRDYNNDQIDTVGVIDPDDPLNESTTILKLPVSDERLNGLKGMILDPDFDENGWIYLFYGPPAEEIKSNHNRLSRFTVRKGKIDRRSEEILLRIPMTRNIRAHFAGDMSWGPEGEILYLSIGDNVECCATGYAPIDERKGRHAYDAQSTSANAANLRGSIIRIIPRDDGSYEIPEGNLFSREKGYGAEINNGKVQPEIYAFGLRNPYRIATDPKTGTLYWGDYGPDAAEWDPSRGQPGIVEYNRTEEPGFFGWPYITGNNVPYRAYNFETETSGQIFNPQQLKNASTNNTGIKNLPPAKKPMIMSPSDWNEFLDYPDEWKKFIEYNSIKDVPFPQIYGGSPMQGPVYRSRSEFGDRALPRYYDGKVFVMERRKNWIKYVTLDSSGNAISVEPFLSNRQFTRPMDMEVGPEGALYLAEWGSGYEGPNDDSGIYRIEQKRTVAITYQNLKLHEWIVTAGETKTLQAKITNRNPAPIRSANVTLKLPSGSGMKIVSEEGTSFDQLLPGQTKMVSWRISIPESAGGAIYSASAQVSYRTKKKNPSAVTRSLTIRARRPVSVPFALNIGGKESLNSNGLTYHPTPHTNIRMSRDINRTQTDDPISNTNHDSLYQSLHFAKNLQYDIPLASGVYDVTFHFLENYVEQPGKRIFSVYIEGNEVIHNLDVYDSVGHDVALKKTIKGVRVRDHELSISTTSQNKHAVLSGIAIRSSEKDQSKPEKKKDREKVDKTVNIEAGDQMKYDTKSFSVEPGNRVKLVLKHVGELPVQSMGHNVVILNKPDRDPIEFAQHALEQGGQLQNDYLPKTVQEDVLAATDMIGGGQTTSIIFVAPDEPGKFPYLCSFPQHAVSMNGIMNVQKSSSSDNRNK